MIDRKLAQKITKTYKTLKTAIQRQNYGGRYNELLTSLDADYKRYKEDCHKALSTDTYLNMVIGGFLKEVNEFKIGLYTSTNSISEQNAQSN